MKNALRLGSGLMLLLQAMLGHAYQTPGSYDFPIPNRYAATVIGTPPELRAVVAKEIPAKIYYIEGIHEVPEIFWYRESGLRFSAALQDHPAPLIFNIGGTGAAFNSAKLVAVQKALYQAGFHVINLSSPTTMSFIINASRSNLAGYAPDDARDLYTVMQKAYGQVKDDIEVTDFHVTGYSLGALHAAFVAKIDQDERVFNLKKVYMINPPVSLYNSAKLMDQVLVDNVPGGINGVGDLLDSIFDNLGKVYKPNEGMRFDSDFIYHAYEAANDEGMLRKDGSGAAGLIGFSFRLTSAGMVFNSDVMTKSGYIVPKDKVFTKHENLTYYARASHLVTFQEYIEQMLIPGLKAKYPNKTADDFVQESSLNSIEYFLTSNTNIHAVTNANEVILAPGELEYLENILGDRLMVYPGGGHCGNMNHTTNVQDMVRFFKGGAI